MRLAVQLCSRVKLAELSARGSAPALGSDVRDISSLSPGIGDNVSTAGWSHSHALRVVGQIVKTFPSNFMEVCRTFGNNYFNRRSCSFSPILLASRFFISDLGTDFGQKKR